MAGSRGSKTSGSRVQSAGTRSESPQDSGVWPVADDNFVWHRLRFSEHTWFADGQKSTGFKLGRSDKTSGTLGLKSPTQLVLEFSEASTNLTEILIVPHSQVASVGLILEDARHIPAREPRNLISQKSRNVRTGETHQTTASADTKLMSSLQTQRTAAVQRVTELSLSEYELIVTGTSPILLSLAKKSSTARYTLKFEYASDVRICCNSNALWFIGGQE